MGQTSRQAGNKRKHRKRKADPATGHTENAGLFGDNEIGREGQADRGETRDRRWLWSDFQPIRPVVREGSAGVSRPEGRQDHGAAAPVAFGVTRMKPVIVRSSRSTKASMKRTGLSGPT